MGLEGFVEELHRKRSLSQTEIARRAGLSQGAIYKILTGIGRPQLATYQKLSRAFPEAWRDYLRRHPSFRRELADTVGWALDEPSDTKRVLSDSVIELADSLEPSHSKERLAQLSAQLRKRYHERVTELTRLVRRELAELLALLEAEARHEQATRGRKRSQRPPPET